ncbi:MAG: tetratricopeptide repeat protein, partial [Spirochaetia bacterium]|nr:tetratricopeptide repeat protein [Spirochaetia bacterium]
PEDLDILRDLRDFELFSTGRPIYLTWKRPDLQSLNVEHFNQLLQQKMNQARQANRPMKPWKLDTLKDIEEAMNKMVPKATFSMVMKNGKSLSEQHLRYLGPWYFQTFGLLQRVTPLRYAIVECLEFYVQASFETIRDYVQSVSQITLTRGDFEKYVDELSREGYVARAGGSYVLVKPQERPFRGMSNEDYWAHYQMRYTNEYNSKDWDFLTREIFGNYHLQQAGLALNLRDLNLKRANMSASAEAKMRYLNQGEENLKRAFHWYDMATFYGQDMGSMFFNYGNVLMRFGRMEQAISNFIQAGEREVDFALPYMNLGSVYWQRANTDEVAKEKANLQTARTYLNKAKKKMEFSYKMRGAPGQEQQTPEYQNVSRLLGKVEGELSVSRDEVQAQQAKVNATRDPNELFKLAQLLEKRQDYQQAASIYDQLIAVDPGNPNLYLAKHQALARNNFIEGLNFLEEVLLIYPRFRNPDPGLLWQIQENLGQNYFHLARNFLSQNNIEGALDAYRKCADYLGRFRMTAAPLVTQNPDVRKRVIQAEKMGQEAEQRIQQIDNYLQQVRGNGRT